MEDLKRGPQQPVKIRRKKLTGVSYEDLDQKKRSDLAQGMKAEYGIFNN